jgi:hypothetical protein
MKRIKKLGCSIIDYCIEIMNNINPPLVAHRPFFHVLARIMYNFLLISSLLNLPTKPTTTREVFQQFLLLLKVVYD